MPSTPPPLPFGLDQYVFRGDEGEVQHWVIIVGLNVVAVGLTVAFCVCLRSIASGRGGGGSAAERERAYRRLVETERYDAERLRLAQVNAEAEAAKTEAEIAKLKKTLAESGVSAADHDAWVKQEQRRLDALERALAKSRHEAALRAAAYREAMEEASRVPSMDELLEEGVSHGSGHSSIKEPIPSFAYVEEPKMLNGTMTPGRVKVTNETAPVGSALGQSPRGNGRDPIGWGSNVYVIPSQLDLPKSERQSARAGAPHCMTYRTIPYAALMVRSTQGWLYSWPLRFNAS